MTLNVSNTEAKLIELFRLLPDDAARELVDYATFKAARTADWSYDDPASCAAAWNRSLADPGFVAEVEAIQREFAETETDGLAGDEY